MFFASVLVFFLCPAAAHFSFVIGVLALHTTLTIH